jgi:hypothetical protein
MHLMVKMLFQLPGVIIESQTSQFLSLPLSYRRSTVVCTGHTGQNAVPATVDLLCFAPDRHLLAAQATFGPRSVFHTKVRGWPENHTCFRKLAGIKRSLTNGRNSRNCRNLQNGQRPCLALACCRLVAAWHRPPHQYLLKRGGWQRGARAGGRGGLVLHRVGTHRGIRHGEPHATSRATAGG